VPLATGEIPLPLRRDPTLNRVLLLCLVIVVAITGQYTFYTYMAPWFLAAAHLPAAAVPGLLFLYGGGGALGLLLAGVAADRFPKRGLAGVLLAAMLAVVVLALGAGSVPVVIAAFLAWGIAFGAVPPLLQSRMMQTASRRTRELAGALQTTAFNVGIGGGSLLGAVLLAGPGMAALPFTSVLLVAAGLVLGFVPELVRHAALRPVLTD
jgi:predicted MFS family arabinose efflux permease